MLFKKEKKTLVNSFDLLHQVVIKNDETFTQMKELSDILVEGKPVLAVFSDVEDEVFGTHVLAFLSGVVYALDGDVFQISVESFLFASKAALEDGSLEEYIKEVGDN